MCLTRPAGLRWIAIAASFSWAACGHATGLGPLVVHSALGQPLHASVVLLGDAESLDSGCVKAKVESLEGALLSDARIMLKRTGQAAAIELVTSRNIHEPAVNVNVALGCTIAMVRNYAALLDPVPLPASIEETGIPLAREDRKTATRRLSGPAMRESGGRPANRFPFHAHGSDRIDKTVNTPRSVLRLSSDGDAGSNLDLLKMSNSLSMPRSAASTLADTAPEPAANRLPEPDRHDPGTEANALQSGLDALSAEMVRMQRQHQADKAALESMRNEQFSFTWIASLAGILLICLLAILWLIWRLHALQSKDQQLPWNKVLAELDAPTDFGSYEDTLSPGSTELRLFATPVDLRKPGMPVGAESAMHTGSPPAGNNGSDAKETRDLEAEEISDAIQLAEFWISFRQPVRAIEALQPYRDIEQPKSPAPWVYLLDLYRSTDNRQEYEALQKRVSQAFNLRVPAWDEPSDGIRSRTLADFPNIVETVHRLWPGDDLLPYLEDLLIDRRDGTRNGFDPEAYRRIMKLIGIAEESRGPDRCHPQTLERLHAILPQPQDPDGIAENADTATSKQRSSEDASHEQTGVVSPDAPNAPATSNEDSVSSPSSSSADGSEGHDGSDMGIKLHLASAYQEIGEADGARLLLDEVIEHGTKDQSEKARRMLAKLV